MALRHRNKRRVYRETLVDLCNAVEAKPALTRVAKMKIINAITKNKIRNKASTDQVNRKLKSLRNLFSARWSAETMRKGKASRRRKQRQKRKGVSK